MLNIEFITYQKGQTMLKIASLTLMVLFGVSSSALAQYTGPVAGKSAVPGTSKKAPYNAAPTTVRALMALDKDDTQVRLEGRIVGHMGGDKYRFADSTGEIDLEIETEHWPANTPIDDTSKVRITGEYDKGLTHKPRVEVERIEKL